MSKDVLLLAIESSCDETAASVVRNGKEILSNVVSSQINVHSKFGGVIPEVASRLHVENVSVVLEEAVKNAGITMDEINGIAYTLGPGLIGSLHVGVIAAKTLALAYNKPLLPVHHIAGHIFANRFVDELEYPLMALVVSGGHTELVYMPDPYHFEVVGQTMDDAIGEAYDKVARVLGLPYPGGPQIDRLAKSGQPVYHLTKPMNDASYNFSFSGLKSNVLQFIDRCKRKGEEYTPENIASSFQESALTLLVGKTVRAAIEYDVKHIVLAGGVAANSRLRSMIQEEFASKAPNVKVTIPPLWCCTDNAAMIGAAGYYAYLQERWGELNDKASPSMELF
ncbi:MAG: tRNA (adenosine(37)-N6)-threonylcarbamoyltransferase complex transferase subunit TsaD [Erysipelotrichales bacterium]|nr:tRNA (adenosine(37)-N6)-threonylcarbamoyltransferase complex transferase subunit TsaD [Erysipelotrichales bacterium]